MNIDWYPLINSLRIAGISCVIVFFTGIFFAYYAAKLPRTIKGVLDVILTLPMVLPPTVCGYLLLLVFGTKRPVGIFLMQFGIKFVMTWYGGILAAAVVAFPLMYRTARGAFESFDPSLAQSGQTLGLEQHHIYSGASACRPAARAYWQAPSLHLHERWASTAQRACSSALPPAKRRRYPQRCISSGALTMTPARCFGS